MAIVKAYWNLFQQQNIIDGLRVFIELSDDFVDLLRREEILPEEAVERVQSYPWPASRTELIQALVRKRWTQEQFEKFHDALLRTQNSQLCKLFNDRMALLTSPDTSSSSSSSELDTEIRLLAFSNHLYTGMDELLKPLPLESRVTIQTLLRNRDVKIVSLQTENELIRGKLSNVTALLSSETSQFKHLDGRLTDWLSKLEIDISSSETRLETDAVVESLEAVDQLIEKQNKRIAQLENEQMELKRTINSLQEEKRNLAQQRLKDSFRDGTRNKNQEVNAESQAEEGPNLRTKTVSTDRLDSAREESVSSKLNDTDWSSESKQNVSMNSSKVKPTRKTSVPLHPKTSAADQLKADHVSRRLSLPKLSCPQDNGQTKSSTPKSPIGVSPKSNTKSPKTTSAVCKTTDYKLSFNKHLE